MEDRESPLQGGEGETRDDPQNMSLSVCPLAMHTEYHSALRTGLEQVPASTYHGYTRSVLHQSNVFACAYFCMGMNSFARDLLTFLLSHRKSEGKS